MSSRSQRLTPDLKGGPMVMCSDKPPLPKLLMKEGGWELLSSDFDIPINKHWLYHCCESLSHKHFYDVYRMNNANPGWYALDAPCTYCGSVAPEGLRALYMMLEAGHDTR